MIRFGQWYVVLFCCDSAESKDKVLVNMSVYWFTFLRNKFKSSFQTLRTGALTQVFRQGQKTLYFTC